MTNILPKKSLGQHWLTDETSLRTIAELSNLAKTDTVLEVGPGKGALTKYLVDQAGQVIAVELDDRLIDLLKNTINTANLTIVSQDILKFDLTSLPKGYKLVANLPYYLTGDFIRKISESPNSPKLAVLLVQEEVAQRLGARPGQMSVLGITAQLYWQVELNIKVPSQAFDPEPKVNSQVVVLKRLNTPMISNKPDFLKLVKLGFSQKRKTLLNNLTGGLGLNRHEVAVLCERAEIDPSRRPQTLSLQEWQRLTQAYLTR